MDLINNILGSVPFIIFIATIMMIAFARCIIKIFKMGATFKTELATKKEMRDFETDMRKDMRAYCLQIQEIVTKSTMQIIENKLHDIEDVKSASTDIKVIKAELESKFDMMNEKFDEIKVVADTTRQMNARIQRLEYGNQQIQTVERRTEK